MGGTDPEGALKPARFATPPPVTSAAAQARRLHASPLPELGVEHDLDAEAVQHAKVLRLAVDDLVRLFDGRGRSALARIVKAGKGALRCVAIEPAVFVERTVKVVLVQCLPKAGKLDDIVRMTTELGVATIALAISEHCVVRPGRGADDHKAERLERIAIEAARQSEQPYLPRILPPRPLAEVLADVPHHAYRAAFVERTERPLPLHLEARELWLVVGPEGGLSPTDREVLRGASFLSTALGRSILRTETAAVVGVALALERFGRSR